MSYPTTACLHLGKIIDNGALTIVTILGAGAFGVVYRAFDTKTKVEYAVKRVEKEGDEYHQTRERLLHARVSSHPNVLTFHREVHEGHYVFFLYNVCAGDLHSVIKVATFFREDELIKRVFLQIVDAVDHCHRRGVYHRDLKPENILVSALSGDIDVFVADFGLATTNKLTASKCGTPYYMSPESLVPDHDVYSAAEGDVWALGCILSEMIGNVRPWSLATPEDKKYNEYLTDRSMLYNSLPISHSAYLLIRKIFSTRPELRPSLAAIRAEVLAMDTFFLSDEEAIGCGWADGVNKRMQIKIRARGGAGSPPTHCSSSKTLTGSDCFVSCDLDSSSESCYSNGSSTSAFDSSSAEFSDMPATPLAPVAEIPRSMQKGSRLVVAPPVVVVDSVFSRTP